MKFTGALLALAASTLLSMGHAHATNGLADNPGRPCVEPTSPLGLLDGRPRQLALATHSFAGYRVAPLQLADDLGTLVTRDLSGIALGPPPRRRELSVGTGLIGAVGLLLDLYARLRAGPFYLLPIAGKDALSGWFVGLTLNLSHD